MFRRTALALPLAAVALAPTLARASTLRSLYEADGSVGPQARARLGSRIALRGFVLPAPALTEDWFALTEIPVAPCTLCGLTHDWPPGTLAAHAPGLPHLASPYESVLLEGTLALEGAAEAGLEGRLALLDARLLAA